MRDVPSPGGVGTGVSAPRLKTLSFQFPPLAEQRAMAEILAVDQEIELLRRSLELERRRKKALAQLLLTGLVRLS